MLNNNNNKITWTVVADGSRGFIYASYMNKHSLNLISSIDDEEARKHSKALGSEKPHGIFERNRPESRVNLHTKEEEHFAEQLAEIINNGATDNKFQNLILIAPPKFLGNLRLKIAKPTAQLITKEINKDLTHMEAKDLESYIW
jgi:protein required for attachment to host cells